MILNVTSKIQEKKSVEQWLLISFFMKKTRRKDDKDDKDEETEGGRGLERTPAAENMR